MADTRTDTNLPVICDPSWNKANFVNIYFWLFPSHFKQIKMSNTSVSSVFHNFYICASSLLDIWIFRFTGDPLHSRALADSRAPLFTQPCPHCSHSRAPGEQWARLCVFTLQGCVQAARLCRGSPVRLCRLKLICMKKVLQHRGPFY